MSPLERFMAFYKDYGSKDKSEYQALYHDDIHFIDPIKEINSFEPLYKYMEGLTANLNYCYFDFNVEESNEQSASLSWVMRFSNKRLAAGKELTVHGVSFIRFKDNKVIYHRDYYDLGEMIYENLTIISWLIKYIKGRL